VDPPNAVGACAVTIDSDSKSKQASQKGKRRGKQM